MPLFVLVSCKKENAFDCFRTNGRAVVESRYPGEFNAIKVSDKINVDIIQGNEYKVDVSAYSNIIKNISTEVREGKLYITNNNTCNFVRGYKKNVTVTVTTPGLVKVENWGVGITTITAPFSVPHMEIIAESSGDIHVNGTFRSLTSHSNGNGDIYVSGNCDSLLVVMYGTNFFYGHALSINSYIFTETNSMGDCFLNALTAKQLDYAIYRSGNIYYRGNPSTVNNLVSEPGKGKLIRED